MSVAFALLGILLVAGLALVAWRVGGEEGPAVAAVRAWAAAQGHRVREAPRAVEVIGAQDGRLFTLSITAGPPPVLLIGVDCAAAAPPGDAAEGLMRTDDGALVSRWTNPAPAHLANLGALVEAMVVAAAELEAAAPGEIGVTPSPPPE